MGADVGRRRPQFQGDGREWHRQEGRRSECGSMIMTVHHLFGKELAALTNGKI
jgi:hypothetical protein